MRFLFDRANDVGHDSIFPVCPLLPNILIYLGRSLFGVGVRHRDTGLKIEPGESFGIETVFIKIGYLFPGIHNSQNPGHRIKPRCRPSGSSTVMAKHTNDLSGMQRDTNVIYGLNTAKIFEMFFNSISGAVVILREIELVSAIHIYLVFN